jgi:hypothetical protein
MILPFSSEKQRFLTFKGHLGMSKQELLLNKGFCPREHWIC